MNVPISASARKRPILATDLYSLRFVNDVALSPDGSRIAFTVTQPDEQTNCNRMSIWVVSTTEGAAQHIASGENSIGSIRWSPDGMHLAFVSEQAGRAQIAVLDLAHGGEAQPLTHQHEDRQMSTPLWSSDGTQIAYLCQVPSLPEPIAPVVYP